MAFRSIGYLRSIANRLRGNASFTTTTTPQAKAYAPAVDHHNAKHQQTKPKPVKGDFVPVYVAIGMIALSVSLGLYTVYQQLFNSPSVRVSKKTRESLPEVEDPDKVVDEASRFLNRSLFRKVAHVPDAIVHKPHSETLRDAGVDPKVLANR